MYQGKHTRKAVSSSKPKRRRRPLFRKEFVVLCSVLVLLIGMVGGSLAYLVTNTEDVKNTFTPPTVDVDVTESFDGNVKKNVKFQNTSDFPVYMRATYAAYWVKDGTDDAPVVYPEAPVLTSTFGSDWGTQKEDGYYYYNKIVAEDAWSTDFIVSMKASNEVEGYHLVVDVIVETVQASPEQAVMDVWGFKPTVS